MLDLRNPTSLFLQNTTLRILRRVVFCSVTTSLHGGRGGTFVYVVANALFRRMRDR